MTDRQSILEWLDRNCGCHRCIYHLDGWMHPEGEEVFDQLVEKIREMDAKEAEQ